MTVTRKELAKTPSEKASFSVERSAELINEVFDLMHGALERGEKVDCRLWEFQRAPEAGQEREESQDGRVTGDFCPQSCHFQAQPHLAESSE